MGETIGQRITRLRNARGWSRPELGRQMAAAIGKKKPFTGELVRLYEEDTNRPSPETRAALAKVFQRPEVYIEFGTQQPAGEYTQLERELLANFRAADPRWQLSLRLLAALAVEDQIEVATDVNVVVARILGKKPAEVRYALNERVAEAYGEAPHVAARKAKEKR